MKKRIIGIIVLLLLAVGGFVGWKFFGPAVNPPEGREDFYISTGASIGQVKENLIYLNIINNDNWFDKTAKLLHYKTIIPGRYKLKKGMSLFKLVRLLRAGNQAPLNFVITKLRTKEDFARKAGNIFEFDSLQMINFLNNTDTLSDYGLDTNTVTAVMMPFTYTLNWNSSPEKVFENCFSAFKKFWTKERLARADSLHLNRIEVITLASIVEEETLKKTDKPLMASVYLNRIRVGMPLQADPTIKFAMKNFALKRILGTHLKTVSPYNTYLNRGLPPGPICTPAVETIDAVLDAPKTDYLYFVASSKFDGSSVFTTNLADHSKYAREYQQELTRRMDSAKKVNPK